MQKITNQNHNQNTFLYAASILFERAGYYGFRGILILFLINNLIFENNDAYEIYGWFAFLLFFTAIIGGLLGDLVIGNKRTLIIGGILQALGIFVISFTSEISLYIGLGLLVIGNGFYTPNMSAVFGKNYLDRQKLLDAGFTMYQTAANLGGFVGVAGLGYISEMYGYKYGFVLAGLCMLLSGIIIVFAEKNPKYNFIMNQPIKRQAIKLLLPILFVVLFWKLYMLGSVQLFSLNINTESIGISRSLLMTLNSAFVVPLGVLAIVYWSFHYYNHWTKLSIGFLFGTIGLLLFFWIPEITQKQDLTLYIFAMFFLAIAEVHISPIIYATITKYVNPKYLAIAMSLAFLPNSLISLLIKYWEDNYNNNPQLSLQLSVLGFGIICIGLFVFLKWRNNQQPKIE